MASADTVPTAAPSGFGEALRVWRRARGLSQLDLALAAGASPRHLSFLETNRAKPSREMVLALADAMVLPRAPRNALLAAAGFAPLYPSTPLQSDLLGPLREALTEMMRRHAPNPALLCDRHWNMLDANASAQALLAGLANGETNIIRMLACNPRAPDLIANLGEVVQEMKERIRLEALEAAYDPVLTDLIAALEAAGERHPPPKPELARRPLVPLVLNGPGGELRFLSAITHFGTSEDIAVRDLRLELLFPADAATIAAMQAFSETG